MRCTRGDLIVGPSLDEGTRRATTARLFASSRRSRLVALEAQHAADTVNRGPARPRGESLAPSGGLEPKRTVWLASPQWSHLQYLRLQRHGADGPAERCHGLGRGRPCIDRSGGMRQSLRGGLAATATLGMGGTPGTRSREDAPLAKEPEGDLHRPLAPRTRGRRTTVAAAPSTSTSSQESRCKSSNFEH